MIAARLRDLFRQDLAKTSLAFESISLAELRAHVTLAPQKGPKLPKIMWAMGGDRFISCQMVITGRVVTAANAWAVRLEGKMEWPEEWKG